MSAPSTDRDVDVVVVGAGFAGLYLLHRLRELGLRVLVLEAGDGVGGTWHWNRYPGARCDVESIEYAFSFSEELTRTWRWTERYAAQPDILAYLNRVADLLELRQDIRLETRVTAARWDGGRWVVTSEAGDRWNPQFVVMATGCLSMPKTPDIPGLDTFAGPVHHTSDWPRDGVDFTGRRVAVVGTGSSGVQAIPLIAEQAAQLHVLQRTPPFCVPAHNHAIEPISEEELTKRRAGAARNPMGACFLDPRPENALPAMTLSPQQREAELERRWALGGLAVNQTFPDLVIDPRANDVLADFIRGKIRAQVHDPAVAEALCPDYPVGAKRLCVDTGYWRAYNRDNVTLVDLRATPLEAVEAAGVRTTAGLIEIDDLVLATGFDAMTGALGAIDIVGRDGVALTQRWAAGPRTYLGLAVAGYPNLFTVTGPGSPSVLSNMRASIEHHGDWITDCLRHLRERGVATIEATTEAQDDWAIHVAEAAGRTLLPSHASWYLGANVPGKPRVFMPYVGGLPAYRDVCAKVAANGYRGFALHLETTSHAPSTGLTTEG